MADWLHHPAFQSLALPALLSLACVALIRTVGARSAAAWGASVGLIGALAVFPGLAWPAGSRLQWLPWVVLAGTVGLALVWGLWRLWGLRGRRSASRGGPPSGSAAGPGGGRRAEPGPGPAPGPRAAGGSALAAGGLGLACFGLAAVAAVGGSLLLAQLALMVGTCSAVLALAAGRDPAGSAAAMPWALMPLAFAALALLQVLWLSWPAELRSGVAPVLRLVLLAVPVVLPVVLPMLLRRSRLAQRHPRAAWAVGLAIALASVVGAGLWQALGGPAAPAGQSDDPYYTPE